VIVILMGVTGCGKTTVGTRLAEKLGWTFRDADDYHPAENVAKMKAGTPLTDADRWPWLDRLNSLLRESEREGANLVLACSALKQAYRERLAQGCAKLRFVFLDGAPELMRARLAARRGHYMNPALLDSQFAALERPQDALRLDADASPESLTQALMQALRL
jgi:gluconokinase